MIQLEQTSYDGGVIGDDAGGGGDPNPYEYDGGGGPGSSAPDAYGGGGGPDEGGLVYQIYDGGGGGGGDASGPGTDAGHAGADAGRDAGGAGADAGRDAGHDAGDGGDGGRCGGQVTTSGICARTSQLIGTVSSTPMGTTSIATQLGGPGTTDWCERFLAKGDNGDFSAGGLWVIPITFSCSGSEAYIQCHITSSAQAASTPYCPEGCNASPVAAADCSGTRDVYLTANVSSGPLTFNMRFLDPDAWSSNKGYFFRQGQEYCTQVYNTITSSLAAACKARANEAAQAACTAYAPTQIDIPVTYTCQ
ncbi:MAG TPA: hypothetical protein VH877_14635 [Polyangia bacterium]|nr:hypothetical protein [Polyangia bacterium]